MGLVVVVIVKKMIKAFSLRLFFFSAPFHNGLLLPGAPTALVYSIIANLTSVSFN